MSARRPRFEVVRGDDGWFARYIAANGKEVWRTSETYVRREAAWNAVRIFEAAVIDHRSDPLELREVDERTAP